MKGPSAGRPASVPGRCAAALRRTVQFYEPARTVDVGRNRCVTSRRALPRPGPGTVVLVAVGTFVGAIAIDAVAARRPAQPPAAQGEFADRLASHDTARWIKADRWSIGSPFANAWRADHVAHNAAGMWITLSNRAYWAGSFTYPGTPLRAHYEWVRFTPGEDCEPRGAP